MAQMKDLFGANEIPIGAKAMRRYNNYVVVPANKAHNNIVFVFKWHYLDCLIKELGIDISLGNQTYTPWHLRQVNPGQS